MHTFPRPQETHLSVERERVDGTCPACGARALASYRVLGEGGLWDVVKCRECLNSVSRERAPRLGSLTPLGLTIRSGAGAPHVGRGGGPRGRSL
jgi:vanillate/4-hydroxybenzoate decarboxylase subunit D